MSADPQGEALVDLLLDEASEADAATTRARLQADPAARREHDALLEAVSALQGLDPAHALDEPPAGFSARLHDALREAYAEGPPGTGEAAGDGPASPEVAPPGLGGAAAAGARSAAHAPPPVGDGAPWWRALVSPPRLAVAAAAMACVLLLVRPGAPEVPTRSFGEVAVRPGEVGALKGVVYENPEVGSVTLEGARASLLERDRLVLDQGIARLSIRPGGLGFRVETPHGMVSVLGTEFDVSVEVGSLVVTVYKGRVRVEPKKGDPVVLVPGADTSTFQYPEAGLGPSAGPPPAPATPRPTATGSLPGAAPRPATASPPQPPTRVGPADGGAASPGRQPAPEPATPAPPAPVAEPASAAPEAAPLEEAPAPPPEATDPPPPEPQVLTPDTIEDGF